MKTDIEYIRLDDVEIFGISDTNEAHRRLNVELLRCRLLRYAVRACVAFILIFSWASSVGARQVPHFKVTVLNDTTVSGAPLYVEMLIKNLGDEPLLVPFPALSLEDAHPKFGIKGTDGSAVPVLRPFYIKAAGEPVERMLAPGDSMIGFFDPTSYVDVTLKSGVAAVPAGTYKLAVSVSLGSHLPTAPDLADTVEFTIIGPSSKEDSIATRLLAIRRRLGESIAIAQRPLDSLLSLTSENGTKLRERAFQRRTTLALAEPDPTRKEATAFMKAYLAEFPKSPFAWELFELLSRSLDPEQRGQLDEWLGHLASSNDRVRSGCQQFGTYATVSSCPALK